MVGATNRIWRKSLKKLLPVMDHFRESGAKVSVAMSTASRNTVVFQYTAL